MKKTTFFNLSAVLIALGAMMCAPSANAQEQRTTTESGLTPKFGFKAGVNFANLYVSDVQNENLKLGLNLGLFAKLPVSRGLSIQPELLYSSKGAKETYGNFYQGSGEYRFNLNYVEVPLLLVINVTKNFSLSAGGYAAYLASANVKDMRSDGSIAGVSELNAEDFHRFDYGLVGGLGVDIGTMTLGARYNYGLQNLGRPGNLSGDLTKDSKNSVATLFVGFAF